MINLIIPSSNPVTFVSAYTEELILNRQEIKRQLGSGGTK